MSNSAVILNGDQIYLEELVRENARLTIQHEADRQRILALSDRVETLEAEASADQDAAERVRATEDELGRIDAPQGY